MEPRTPTKLNSDAGLDQGGIFSLHRSIHPWGCAGRPARWKWPPLDPSTPGRSIRAVPRTVAQSGGQV